MTALRRPPDLPDFKSPPVTEVVLSIQFGALAKFTSVHVGLLWERLRSEYPIASEQAPIAAAFETFGLPQQNLQPFMEIQTLLSPPMPRYWFEDADAVDLLQVQHDRILHNWRKREAAQEYPRYEAIRARFERDLALFEEFLSSEGLGNLRPNQCEVTYINTIDVPDDDNVHQHLERVTPLWTGQLSEAHPYVTENATLQTRFLLRHDDQPFGRAFVVFTPAFMVASNRPVWRLEITVRGKPSHDSVQEAFKLLDEGRDIVVRTFAGVTTPEMWRLWERTDA